MSVDPRRVPQSRAGRQTGQSGEVRFTRKWFVLGVGAIVAGLAGLAALLRRDGTSLQGVVTAPESVFGAFPVRSVERQPPTKAPEDWVVTVDGLVEKPLTLDHAAWVALERFEQTVDFHCVEGWSVDDVRWGGVAPSVLLELAGVKPEATHVTFYAAGGTYKDGLPLDLVRDPQTLLADTLGDEPLPPAHGGPLRLVVPDQLGYKSVKWVERLEVTNEQVEGYWEERGYPADAPVA
jgi:DMSO/TMAO reductase YedYZ molybdopterin-dependent catalytic subunit